MAQILGKCPFCEDGIVSYNIKVINGRKTKLYSCSWNKVTTVDEGETWERTEDATCNFKIFGNALQRYGKKFIGPKEVIKLLKGEDLIVHLYSFQKKVEYKKYATLDEEYGISILWEIDINEDEDKNDKVLYN